jgi:hypothetical protein
MPETDATHPTLLAVARGTSTLALIVMVVALGGLMIRLLSLFQPMACPMGPLGQIGLYPLQTSPGGLSCVADLTQTQSAQTASERLSATIKPVVENANLIATFLVAATVRVGIGRLWPSLRHRAEQTEGNA